MDDPTPALNAYERGRTLDVRLRTAVVDALSRTLLTAFPPLDLARGAGLLLIDLVPPLRRAAMREGLAPTLGTPRLMRRIDVADELTGEGLAVF